MLLDSDDLTDPKARRRVRMLFSRAEVLEIAKKGVPFRPMEGDTGARAGDVFLRRDGATVCVAAFNYDRKVTRHATISLARLGLSGTWSARNLWTNEQRTVIAKLTLELAPMDCALVRLSRAPE